MPVTRLLVEGELDAELLHPICEGRPVVEAIKSSKNALAPRTRHEREKTGPCVCYVRDRDFDYDPPPQTDRPCLDREDESLPLGWRWCRHSIENYMLEPTIVSKTLVDVQEDSYREELLKAAQTIKYYQAARWAIGVARVSLPPNYELRTQWEEEKKKDFHLPPQEKLFGREMRNWAIESVNAFVTRLLPELDAQVIAKHYAEYATKFDDKTFLSIESTLLYFSGRDLMMALDNWWRPQGIQSAKELRNRLRQWMRDNPEQVLETLTEWRSLVSLCRQS
jgi:hypothetical protein